MQIEKDDAAIMLWIAVGIMSAGKKNTLTEIVIVLSPSSQISGYKPNYATAVSFQIVVLIIIIILLPTVLSYESQLLTVS